MKAAAPDMYEALEAARTYVEQAYFRAGDNDKGEQEALTKVCNSLAKARGES